MDVLNAAIEKRRLLRVHSSNSTSVVQLLPVKRSHASFAFSAGGDKYLRIVKSGKTDLNGGGAGPWTEFSITADDSGELMLQGTKSGCWLTIADGEFTSTEEPERLRMEFAGADSARVDAEPKGSEIRLQFVDGSRTLKWPVRPVELKGNIVLLAIVGSGNLKCGPGGNFQPTGKEGPWSQWDLQETSSGISLRNIGHDKYLALAPAGVPQLSDTAVFFTLGEKAVPTLPVDRTALSTDDVTHFKEKGYIILRNAVSPDLVRDALRCINSQLGKPDCWEADNDSFNLGGQKKLKFDSKEFAQQIFNGSSVLWSAANILLGEGNVVPWAKAGAHVALRFPQPLEDGYDVHIANPGKRYHLDGMSEGRLCPFSLLCGVALSDQMQPDMGNLHVFPGSHLHDGLRQYYREKISDDNQNEADMDKPDLGASVQVLLRPGDVVIAHQLLAHRVGINLSEHIRYQLYYRAHHKDQAELKPKILDDPWAAFAFDA